MVTVWESVCRTSVTVVKAYRNFAEQMPDHDDLLQSVCWTVTGRGRLRYFALCSCVYKYHILVAPPPVYGFLDTCGGGYIVNTTAICICHCYKLHTS